MSDIGWDDSTVEEEEVTNKRTLRFVPNIPMAEDLIKIVSSCWAYGFHGWKRWENGQVSHAPCTQKYHGMCPLCDNGERLSTRYLAVVWVIGSTPVNNETQDSIRIWRFSSNVYTMLRMINQEYDGVNDIVLSIKNPEKNPDAANMQKVQILPRPSMKGYNLAPAKLPAFEKAVEDLKYYMEMPPRVAYKFYYGEDPTPGQFETAPTIQSAITAYTEGK